MKTNEARAFPKADADINYAILAWKRTHVNTLIAECLMEIAPEAVMALPGDDPEKKIKKVLDQCSPAEWISILGTMCIIYNVHIGTIAGVLEMNPDWLVGFSVPDETRVRPRQ